MPQAWAAGKGRAGVNFLPGLDRTAAREVARQVKLHARSDDVVVTSLHWGGNWGYQIPPEHRDFAHRLIGEAGVDIVWSHSSHHPKAIEDHNDRLTLFGCGDFLNDYEGIRKYERFRSDLTLMYFPEVRLSDGALRGLVMVPLQIRNFRLQRVSVDQARWLGGVLTREREMTGSRIEPGADNVLTLDWEGADV